MTLDAWTLKQIQDHIATGLPLVPLFNITVLEANAEQAIVRLGAGELATRPGGNVTGPVQFALVAVSIYALILAATDDLVPHATGTYSLPGGSLSGGSLTVVGD